MSHVNKFEQVHVVVGGSPHVVVMVRHMRIDWHDRKLYFPQNTYAGGSNRVQYVPAQVRPITDRNTNPAAAATARKKKERNSALLMNDWRYFKAAYACIKANTPEKYRSKSGQNTGETLPRAKLRLWIKMGKTGICCRATFASYSSPQMLLHMLARDDVIDEQNYLTMTSTDSVYLNHGFTYRRPPCARSFWAVGTRQTEPASTGLNPRCKTSCMLKNKTKNGIKHSI